MKVLVRLAAGWLGLTVLVFVLLFWHGVGISFGSAPHTWPGALGLWAVVIGVAVLAVLGAIAAYGLWTFREAGRKVALAYAAVLGVLCLVAGMKMGGGTALLPVVPFTLLLLALITPQVRRSFTGAE